MKYFIDDNIWWAGQKQPPKKVRLVAVIPHNDGLTALCYDSDGDEYTLPLNEIYDDNM